MSSPTEFTALRDLVKDSLAKYEAALGASQLPHPELTAPTLHPTDDPNFLPTKELYDSREQLVGALGLLKSAVQVPAERLMAESLAVSDARRLACARWPEEQKSTADCVCDAFAAPH